MTAAELTLIEFAGIPYAGKTRICEALARKLKYHGVSHDIITEFSGTTDFYERMKLTPEVNFLRALHFIQALSEIAVRHRGLHYVLVDRGLYDTHCWFKWFNNRNELPTYMASTLAALISSLPYYTKKYRVVWIHKALEDAIRHHGNRPGRIVNTANLKQLQTIYRDERSTFNNIMSFHSIDSSHSNADQVAESLMQQLKISTI